MSPRIAYPLWMLASVALSVWAGEVGLCIGAGVLGLGAQLVVARGWKTERGTVALANLLTMLRLGLVTALPLLFASLPRALFVALVLAILVLDGIDGYVARTRGEASTFGASFDMETDALTVMVLCLLLHREGSIGAWVLIPGLWRYVYATSISLVPPLGDCPPSPVYRWIFCALMIALAGAFLPWTTVPRICAAAGTIMVSFSFLHSIVRSRAFRNTD